MHPTQAHKAELMPRLKTLVRAAGDVVSHAASTGFRAHKNLHLYSDIVSACVVELEPLNDMDVSFPLLFNSALSTARVLGMLTHWHYFDEKTFAGEKVDDDLYAAVMSTLTASSDASAWEAFPLRNTKEWISVLENADILEVTNEQNWFYAWRVYLSTDSSVVINTPLFLKVKLNLAPLHLAVISGTLSASSFDDLDVRARNGYSALHLAAKYGRARECSELLAAGANPFSVDSKGSTPYEVAMKACDPSFCPVLLAVHMRASLDVNRNAVLLECIARLHVLGYSCGVVTKFADGDALKWLTNTLDFISKLISKPFSESYAEFDLDWVTRFCAATSSCALIVLQLNRPRFNPHSFSPFVALNILQSLRCVSSTSLAPGLHTFASLSKQVNAMAAELLCAVAEARAAAAAVQLLAAEEEEAAAAALRAARKRASERQNVAVAAVLPPPSLKRAKEELRAAEEAHRVAQSRVYMAKRDTRAEAVAAAARTKSALTRAKHQITAAVKAERPPPPPPPPEAAPVCLWGPPPPPPPAAPSDVLATLLPGLAVADEECTFCTEERPLARTRCCGRRLLCASCVVDFAGARCSCGGVV